MSSISVGGSSTVAPSAGTDQARRDRIGPIVQRVGGALLLVLGLLLVTGAYDRLTSYLARFTPAAGGL